MDFEKKYSLPTDSSYAIKLKTLIDTDDYLKIASVRNKCPDSNFKSPIALSFNGKVTNVTDCVMDEIDLIDFSRRNISYSSHKNLSLFISLITFLTIIGASVTNY